MGCRVGMATDVEVRVAQLKANKTVPQHAEYTVVEDGLTYDQATEYEKKLREECGPNCDGEEGGRRVDDKSWSVYWLDW